MQILIGFDLNFIESYYTIFNNKIPRDLSMFNYSPSMWMIIVYMTRIAYLVE